MSGEVGQESQWETPASGAAVTTQSLILQKDSDGIWMAATAGERNDGGFSKDSDGNVMIDDGGSPTLDIVRIGKTIVTKD